MLVIEWPMEPEVVGDNKVWVTACERLRISERKRGRKTNFSAEIRIDEKYDSCEYDPLGSTYVKYYNTLREAAEAAERTLVSAVASATDRVITNREDLLTVQNPTTTAVQENPLKKRQEKTVSTATKNSVFKVNEGKVRKMLLAMALPKKAGATLDRVEQYINEPERWVANAEDPEGEDAELLRQIMDAREDGDYIKVIPDAEEPKEVKPEPKAEAKTEKAEKAKKEKPAPVEEAEEVEEEPLAEQSDELPQPQWTVVSEALVKLDESLIKEFHEMTPFPRDRGIKKAVLAVLNEACDTNTYRGSELASVTVEETNTTYRANGKHTCLVMTARLDDGEELPDVQMLVRRFYCETMEQAVALYQTFDPQSSGRSKGDLIRCYGNADSALEKVSDAVLKLVTPAIAYSEWGQDYKKHSTTEQSHLMLKNVDFVLWFGSVISQRSEGKHLWRLPVVTAMYRTYLVDKDAAKVFWSSVRHGTEEGGTSSDSLKEWLERMKFGAVNAASKDRATEREALYHCIMAWNAYRSEDVEYPPTGKKKYKSDSGIPEAL